MTFRGPDGTAVKPLTQQQSLVCANMSMYQNVLEVKTGLTVVLKDIFWYFYTWSQSLHVLVDK